MEEKLNDVSAYISAFLGIDISTLSPTDYLKYLSVLVEFAESAKPLVEKYVGDFDHVKERADALRSEEANHILEVLLS